MAFLPKLAFCFARFVAREHRWNSGRRREWNGGLRRRHHGHHGNRWVPRRRFGPGGGLRRRLRGNRSAPQQHNRHGNRWLQRHRYHGEPGASTTAAVRREQTPVVAAEPAVVVAAPEVTAPEIAEEVVVAENEIEASASHVTADPEDLMPPLPPFVVPPMEWLLGGPSAGWLVDDPEREYSGDELETPPPGNRPRLQPPTPPDEVAEHFAPPGYADMTEFFEPPVAAPVDAPPTALPDLNLPAQEAEEEKNQDAAPSLALPTPSPEARVLLRRFASTMAARSSGIRRGTWSPEALGLANRVAELHLNEAAPQLPSSSVEESGRR